MQAFRIESHHPAGAGFVRVLPFASVKQAVEWAAAKSAPGAEITIEPRIPLATDQLQAKRFWMAVGAAFQSGRSECVDCGYCQGFEGAPDERLTECTLRDNPQSCPALQADLRAEADAASTGGAA